MKVNYKKVNDLLIVVLDTTIKTFQKGEYEEEDLKLITDLCISSTSKELTSEEVDMLYRFFFRVELNRQAEANSIKITKVKSLDYEENAEKRVENASKVVDNTIFESDNLGFVYLKGFSTPIHQTLVDAIIDAKENVESPYSFDSLVLFTKWLMLNPDKHIRDSLFGWIKTSKLAITSEGNIISYRNVVTTNKGVNNKLNNFITESYLKIKKAKKSTSKIVALLDNDGEPFLEEATTDYNLRVQYEEVINNSSTKTIYTDNHTKAMHIELGVPVSMPRKDCDNDPYSSCSSGLHQMSKGYRLKLGDALLTCLVNPYNVVAIPSYDNTKFRCCEYLPVGLTEVVDGEIAEFVEGTYDIPYTMSTLKIEDFDKLLEEGELSEEISKADFNAIIDMSVIINKAKENAQRIKSLS